MQKELKILYSPFEDKYFIGYLIFEDGDSKHYEIVKPTWHRLRKVNCNANKDIVMLGQTDSLTAIGSWSS